MGKWELDVLVTSGEGVQSLFVSDHILVGILSPACHKKSFVQFPPFL